MDEPTRPNGDLGRLRHKRAYKCGQITKIHKKIMEIQDNHPDDINIYDINDLSKDLKAHIKDHDTYHSDIEDLVQEDEDSALLEEQERDKHHELHRDLNKALLMLRDSLPLWDECKVLVRDMDATLDESETDSPHFRTMADALLK